jgi:outer membrane protein
MSLLSPRPAHLVVGAPEAARTGTPARRRPRAIALQVGVGLALAALAGFARAQSLQDLYQAALQYDATYLSARASLDAAQYRLEQQYALRRPSVGLTVSAGRQLSATPDASTQSAATNAYSATINGTQSLFNRPNDKIIAQAEKALESARTDFQSAEQDLILRISQAYFDVLAAQDTLATARSSKEAISEQVASAKRNFEVGTATITDTREAQARFDLARATEIQAENDLLTRRVLLDQLVGRANVAPKQLAVPVALPAIVPPEIDDWVKRADVEHPQVRKARLNLDIARLETEKARAQSLPTIAANASVGRGHSSTYGDALPTGFNNSLPYSQVSPSRNAGIGLTLNVPLFAGFAIQNRVRETLVLEDKTTDDLEAVRRSVAQNTRTAFYGLRSGAAQVSALEAAESSTQLALEATQLGYKVGVRVNIDVLNAQAQLYNTQAQLAQARYNVVMAGLRLRQASGQLTADDVAAVNRLLQP